MTLHNEIMNIPSKHDGRENAIAYKTGHRDARHDAAELSLKYQIYIELLEEEVDWPDRVEYLRKAAGL